MKSKSVALMLAAALGAAIPSSLSNWGEKQIFRPRAERKAQKQRDDEAIAAAEAKRLRKQQKRLAHAPI